MVTETVQICLLCFIFCRRRIVVEGRNSGAPCNGLESMIPDHEKNDLNSGEGTYGLSVVSFLLPWRFLANWTN